MAEMRGEYNRAQVLKEICHLTKTVLSVAKDKRRAVAGVETPSGDRTEMSVCKKSPGLFVQFRIGALVGARVNLGINRKTSGPSLDHEINRDETLEQRNR